MELRATLKRLPFAEPAYALLRLLRGRNARFAADYRFNSGVGSSLDSTEEVSKSLPSLLQSYSVRSLLDIPCGDFTWMRKIDLGPVAYTGADIIESLVAAHQIQHGSAQRDFRLLDIVTSDLPQVDMILCRDCLPHFSNRLIKRTVNNIKRSGSRYLLSTTFPEHSTNRGIVTGSWQPLNLSAPPFNFPPPISLLREGHPAPYEDKSLALWRIQELPTF